ncbi:MAG TPA: biosynthetic peptidoglycan transglycosylase [Kofleriaceae bacterium]|nr:biosynthetic peptidoglycan transglycosylase [Kofleriaceae bacterium]
MWAAALVLAIIVGALAFIGLVYFRLPDVDPLRTERPAATRYMELRARELAVPVGGMARSWVDLDRLPQQLVCAVLLAEDDGFFRHRGIAWSQVRVAARRYWQGKRTGGASTITQQLARNIFLGPERTLRRKLKEALLAHKLESSLDKRRILELYLNLIEWAPEGVWGADAASRHYFGQPARALSLFDSVFLVGLIAAPREPLSGPNRARAQRVQRRVLDTMYQVHLIEGPEWAETYARLDLVHASLVAGTRVTDALRAARAVSPGASLPPPARPDHPPIRWASALDAECGHQRIPLPARRAAR